MRKIGLLGGSFDPIHFGHINLAVEILEKASLDEILFCPANISPHKIDLPPKATAKQRLDMVKLAIEGIDEFSIYDEEIERKNISYTIDTLRALRKKYSSDVEINLILTPSLLENLDSWKECNDLFELANIIIASDTNFIENNLPRCLKEISNKNIIITRRFEVSSTDVRSRLSSSAYCGHLVPSKVLDYIYKHSLY